MSFSEMLIELQRKELTLLIYYFCEKNSILFDGTR